MTDIGKKKREYNGLTIFELVSHPVTHATVCGGVEHQKWTGNFTIDRTEGSYRYGNEIQFVLWSQDPPKIKLERAPNDGYFRIEICIPQEEAVQLLETALYRIYNSHRKEAVELPEKEAVMVVDFMRLKKSLRLFVNIV